MTVTRRGDRGPRFELYLVIPCKSGPERELCQQGNSLITILYHMGVIPVCAE